MNLLMRTFSACVVSLKCQILAEMDCTGSTEGTKRIDCGPMDFLSLFPCKNEENYSFFPDYMEKMCLELCREMQQAAFNCKQPCI